jgi:hypothetical protein
MTITTTPKEMPAGGGNPTAGAINDLDFPTAQRQGNAFQNLRAAFALRGCSLHRTDPTDGPVTYWVERWGIVRCLPTLHDVAHMLAQGRQQQ